MWNIVRRLREPSTLTAIGAAMALFGIPGADTLITGIDQMAGGAMLLAGALVPERTGK